MRSEATRAGRKERSDEAPRIGTVLTPPIKLPSLVDIAVAVAFSSQFAPIPQRFGRKAPGPSPARWPSLAQSALERLEGHLPEPKLAPVLSMPPSSVVYGSVPPPSPPATALPFPVPRRAPPDSFGHKPSKLRPREFVAATSPSAGSSVPFPHGPIERQGRQQVPSREGEKSGKLR